ncbi:MAG: hypothetical protein HEP71_33585 [Roseivirga sp.]|nr:hypothetical protein [Roseivirga sp.]
MRSNFLNRGLKGIFLSLLLLNAFIASGQQVAFQGFEGTAADNWGFTSSPAFYNLGADFWEIRSSTPQIPTAYDGKFAGGVDLRNANNSTGYTTLTFDPVAITTKVDVRLRFQYVGYDNGDSIHFEVAYDNGSDWSSPDAIVPINVISQSDNSDGWEEASHTVLAGPTHVRARLVIFQNGSDDIGVDSFEVLVNTDPDPVIPPVPIYVSKFGSNGSGNGQFSFPEGVAVHPSTGDIWVADKNNNRVQIFNSSGVYQSQFGSTGSGNGQFNNSVLEIDFDASGNAWVVDRDNHRIQKFSSTGTYLSQFGTNGTGNGQLSFPEGVAVHPITGDIWVADKNNERVQIFNNSGVYQSQFGSEGAGDGQFNASGAVDLDFDASGNVWVIDQSNHRVQKFNSAGVYQMQFGRLGGADDELLFPGSVAIHPNGDIWVADVLNEHVRIYDNTGTYVTTFGGRGGTGNGEFGSDGLVDIAFDAAGDAWVVDRTNHRLQKFDVDYSAAPSSVTVSATVFIEGAFNGTNLNTTLNASIPLSQPYTNNGHAGGESAGSVPANAVDWVLVELREAGSAAAALSSTKVGSAAGFLMNDGTIRATDGSSNLTVSLSGNSGADFHVVIYHRNHLPIMSANAVSESSSTYTIDFTGSSANTYQTTSALTALTGGKFAMIAGDADGDGDVDATDLTTWQSQNGDPFNYNSTNGDFNLDGEINAVDRNDFQQKNVSKTSQVPTT